MLMEFIGKIRQVRTEMNIDPGKRIHVLVKGQTIRKLVETYQKQVLLLARAEHVEFVSDFPQDRQLARGVIADAEIGIDLAGVLDLQTEKERLAERAQKDQRGPFAC